MTGEYQSEHAGYSDKGNKFGNMAPDNKYDSIRLTGRSRGS